MGPGTRGESAARVLERQCWELYVRGATYQQIAETVGRSRGTVEAAVERARTYRAAIAPEETERIRELRMAGLMSQKLDLERRLQAPHPLLDRSGRVVQVEQRQPDGSTRMVPAEDHQVVAALHRELRGIDDRIAKLTGSDAATRYEIETPMGRVEAREVKVVELKERVRGIRLLPRPEAIDVDSREQVSERKEA